MFLNMLKPPISCVFITTQLGIVLNDCDILGELFVRWDGLVKTLIGKRIVYDPLFHEITGKNN